MKKFSDLNEKTQHNKYSGNDKIRNNIFNVMRDTLKVQVDDIIDESCQIDGYEKCVENIKKLLDKKLIQQEIDFLTKIK